HKRKIYLDLKRLNNILMVNLNVFLLLIYLTKVLTFKQSIHCYLLDKQNLLLYLLSKLDEYLDWLMVRITMSLSTSLETIDMPIQSYKCCLMAKPLESDKTNISQLFQQLVRSI